MTVSFFGDLCVNSPVTQDILADALKQHLNNIDFNFACLEAPICSSDLPQYTKIGPNLKQNESVNLFFPFFSHLSLANNHIMDYGLEGCLQTISYLGQNGVLGVGAGDSYPQMYRPTIIERDGVSAAVFCWGESQYGCCKSQFEKGGYAWLMSPITFQLINEYKSKVDQVILFIHAGLEDEEIPLIDWRLYYRSLIDFGVDLIIASHPHIIQGKEIYKGKSIYYSLGNFYFNGEYASNNKEWTTSMSVKCEISKSSIKTTEYFISFSSGRVDFSSGNDKEHFSKLNELLKDCNWPKYREEHDNMLNRVWNDYYKSYYSFPLWKEKASDIPLYKKMFNRIFKGYAHRCFLPPISSNKLYHNISIETHRFAVSRICSMHANTY